jgi:hypothetical protein
VVVPTGIALRKVEGDTVACVGRGGKGAGAAAAALAGCRMVVPVAVVDQVSEA